MPATFRHGIRTNAPDTIYSGTLSNSTTKTTLLGWTFPVQWLTHPWGIRFLAVINLTTGLLPPALSLSLNLGSSSLVLTGSSLVGLSSGTLNFEGAIFSTAAAAQKAWIKLLQPTAILGGNLVQAATASWTEDVSSPIAANIAAQFGSAVATTSLTLFGGTADVR